MYLLNSTKELLRKNEYDYQNDSHCTLDETPARFLV